MSFTGIGRWGEMGGVSGGLTSSFREIIKLYKHDHVGETLMSQKGRRYEQIVFYCIC